jgi:uncharacterized RDD family membrane protein YckC
MSDTTQDTRVDLPDPVSHPELFDGVLQRRMIAYMIDFGLMAAAIAVLMLVGLVLSVLTLGLGAVTLPLIIPAVIIGYYALTLGSSRRATIGMSAMDIVLTPRRGRPLDGWKILVHPLVFWISCWFAWPLSLAFALFTPRREMVHDLVTGTLMVRRSPMEAHWRRLQA